MKILRALLLLTGIVGALAFASVLVASFVDPGYVEDIGRDLIRRQVQKQVNEKIDALDEKFLAGKAGRLVQGYAGEISSLRQQLKEGAPEKLATVIAQMRDLNCECRRKVAADIRDGFQWRILSAANAQERLAALIRARYMETAGKLTREFRIFAATNATVFALLAIAVLRKRGAGVHLLPAALVLVLAAAITGYLYLFNQNWLDTIVFGNYVGFAYVGYMAIAFALLADIVFNRARISARLLNFLFRMIGDATYVLPC